MNISQQFSENLITLLLTAGVSSFLIPYILKSIEVKRARSTKIVAAQSKLLDDITHSLWKWRYMAIKVAYYGGGNEDEKYQKSRQEYDEHVWDVLNQLREEISRVRRLGSEKAYQELITLYKYIVDIDKELSALMSNKQLEGAYRKLNDKIYDQATSKIDNTLNLLAASMHLKGGL